MQHLAALFALFALLVGVIAHVDTESERNERATAVASGLERLVTDVAPIAVPTTGPTSSTIPLDTSTTTTTRQPLSPVTFDSLDQIATIIDFADFTAQGPARWLDSVGNLTEVSLVSSADGEAQPVFWLPPSGDHDQPVVVVLHSWSAQYTQHAGIPFATWAEENGWAMIAPEFRGKNDDPAAVGSPLAVQDVVDAIDFAVAQPGVDEERVFVVGYSGGGMMALLTAGQHPDRVTAVSAWGPPHDLENFYDFARTKSLGYADDIERACGGDPRREAEAQEECWSRSPSSVLDVVAAQEIPVFIGQGIRDPFVMRNAAADVFNALAHSEDRLSDEDIELLRRGRIPGESVDAVTIETHFDEKDPDPVFARASASVLMVYFADEHDLVYGAVAEWFSTDPRRPAG